MDIALEREKLKALEREHVEVERLTPGNRDASF